MSDPVAKARRSRFKDARQQSAPDVLRQKPKNKPKGPRPWHVVGPSWFGDQESTWYKCATEQQAVDLLDKYARSVTAPYLRPPRVEYRPKT